MATTTKVRKGSRVVASFNGKDVAGTVVHVWRKWHNAETGETCDLFQVTFDTRQPVSHGHAMTTGETFRASELKAE